MMVSTIASVKTFILLAGLYTVIVDTCELQWVFKLMGNLMIDWVEFNIITLAAIWEAHVKDMG